MFDKLIEWLISIIKDVLPFFIVYQYEKCVLFAGGKTYGIYGPGFHLKFPFYDEPYSVTVTTTTVTTSYQSFVTKDGKDVTTRAVCKYNIEDIKKYVEGVNDAVDAITDIAQGHIMRIINAKTWGECGDIEDLNNKITIVVRRDVKKYGIAIEQITLTDLIQAPSFRFFSDPTTTLR